MTEIAEVAELFWRFIVVSLLAFGGGSAALPLIERIAVLETGWLTSEDFAAAVAFGYITPGPVLITATFVGYRAAGILGAISATLGIFLIPWLLAALAAQQVQRYLQHPLLQAFGRGAAPAVIGLLAVTVIALTRSSFSGWPFILIALVAVGLSLKTKVHPILILIGCALGGSLFGYFDQLDL